MVIFLIGASGATSKETVSKFTELKDLSNLIAKSKSFIYNQEGEKGKNYFESKTDVCSIVYRGYTVLPSPYFSVFVDPLKELFTNSFEDICDIIEQNNDETPFRDWLDTIQQRHEGYLKAPTQAFEHDRQLLAEQDKNKLALELSILRDRLTSEYMYRRL